ncbi:hypothetical protein [Paenibacillus sp. GCM10027626]|uniref:hypothetical protein n=1 Tax=Paenibacillus sp. GCM10027626 TaxID=3273411 RepID=UPI00362ADF39
MEKQDEKRLEIERELAEQLQPEEVDEQERDRRVRAKLSPKYEIRVQAVHDPIVEETRQYRQMAREVDNRYDKYFNQDADEKKED